ncbi:hypothetical protein QYM36_006424 [Artemia franciscana]|uniref:Uncharacterized protein n=2 Tax=Artemia franciscana TaxID=6661 RepID=A0AA88LDK5_ARTSF|nr:hypothetical protein QYM36_006424 [Artemia franciscana]
MKSQKYSDQDSTSTPATGSSASYESTDSVFIWDNHFANQFEQFSYDSINENDERPKEHVPNLWDPQSAIICEDFLEQLSPCSLRVTKLKLQYSTPDIVKSVDLSETCLKKSVEKVDSDTGSSQCTPTHSRCMKLQERRGSTHSLSLALKAVDLTDELIDLPQEK